jgi:hypothetical protein|tara:strand:- start:13413 stop:13547 length:135 start_codon:yes stop_codon:yes gene_type:complete
MSFIDITAKLIIRFQSDQGELNEKVAYSIIYSNVDVVFINEYDE